MIWRTILFLAVLYLIVYLLAKSLGAFFRQIGRHQPKPNLSMKEVPKPTLQVRDGDIEDAKFEDLPDSEPVRGKTEEQAE